MSARMLWAAAGALVAAVLTAAVGTRPAEARTVATPEAVLREIFGPQAEIRPETVFLTEAQAEAARRRAGAAEDLSALVSRYEIRRGGAVAGYAYLDTHKVRTLRETVLVSVDPEGSVLRVDIIAFLEPGEYRPREAWLRQFTGKDAGDPLRPGRDIHGIAGATLSARAVAAAVRRVVAVHAVLAGGDAAEGDART